jgi:hypothetical protein
MDHPELPNGKMVASENVEKHSTNTQISASQNRQELPIMPLPPKNDINWYYFDVFYNNSKMMSRILYI